MPSSARSPRRFTASLRKDETAKTVRPTGVPEKGAAQFETLRLLNHLNDALPGGGFRLDFSDGEITFRHCLHLGAAPLDPESVRCALALVCYAVDHPLTTITFP